ncbi:protein Skeletor, isoforms B/C-like [Haemaphysalis longicornis]
MELHEAYFWIGKGSQGPDQTSGNMTTDEEGSFESLKAYTNSRVLLTLPMKITEYDYIGIFCVTLNQSFGEVFIPTGFELPVEQKLDHIVGHLHDVKADEVWLKDSATIELKQFHYDGKGLDVRFAVGPSKNTPRDELTKLPDENGRNTMLGNYSGKNLSLKLPDGKHWADYQWFTVLSFQSSVSFAGLEIKPEKSQNLPVHNPSSDVHKSEASEKVEPSGVGGPPEGAATAAATGTATSTAG